MNNLGNALKITLLLILNLPFTIAYADVYKCVVNGKIVYSDSRCAYQPDIVKISPNQNALPSAQPSPRNNSYNSEPSVSNNLESSNENCAYLLEKVTRMTADLGRGSYNERIKKVNERNAARYEYEATCMNAANRDAQVQNRNNKKMQQQLNDIQRQQTEIQNKQRGYGY